MKVPKIVPLPPKTEVPPTKTAARVVNIKPDPCVGQKYNISYIVNIPARAEKNPSWTKAIIFTLSTFIPIIWALALLSPTKWIWFPNLWYR